MTCRLPTVEIECGLISEDMFLASYDKQSSFNHQSPTLPAANHASKLKHDGAVPLGLELRLHNRSYCQIYSPFSIMAGLNKCTTAWSMENGRQLRKHSIRVS